jgi:Transglutaminase-like superfamily
MLPLILKAYCKLIEFDLYLLRGDFSALRRKVRHCNVKKRPLAADPARICSAVDMACVWYWKRALCLQRSATITCLLRQHGIRAQMVIGVQHTPFRAHAWVESEEGIVGAGSDFARSCAVMDRF